MLKEKYSVFAGLGYYTFYFRSRNAVFTKEVFNRLDYFELYPEKRPSVVAVYCPYGTLMVDVNTPVMKWVEENYSVGDVGQYWLYYR